MAIGALAVLTVLSALRYGAYFYPYLNSDMAMHVLMARGFELHHSLWYWGQTRLGSLLPMLAFIPWKLGVDPLKAVTLVQYAMVSSTLVLFGLIMRNVWATLFFSLLFLFPGPADVCLIEPGHPYLPHLMLSLAGVFILQGYDGKKPLIGTALVSLFWLIGSVAVWVSDMALVTVPVILAWRLLGVFGHDLRKWTRSFAGLSLFTGPVLLYAWAKLLKRQAIDWSGYTGSGLAHPDVVITGLGQLWSRAFHPVQYSDPFTRWVLVMWLIIGLTGSVVILYRFASNRSDGVSVAASLPVLFLALGAAMFCATMASGWAARSGYDGRYLSMPALMFVMATLALWAEWDRRWLRLLIASTATAASVGGYLAFTEHWNWNYGNKFIGNENTRQRLEAMTSSSIIGDYWFCYVMAAYNSNEIIPMAFDDQFYRNGHQVDAAFLSDSIFVCTDPAHPALPDTLMQHGRTLVRTTEPAFEVGNTTLGRYTVIRQPEKKQPHP